jgi:diguanylate cyclase (GGDEF)-like protein
MDAVSQRILIVDDDAVIVDVISQYLKLAGFACCQAKSAEEALAHLARNPADLVITDILLPGQDGLALTEIVRRDHGAHVIVMTGHGGLYSYEQVVSKGASDFVLKPLRFEELVLRVQRVLHERQLASERERMLRQLQRLAITDELTQLKNARFFSEQLSMETHRAARYLRPLALVLLDIDHFKRINDTFGHIAGDRVLAKLGQVINGSLRAMDSAYRYGGEEFTLLLPETGSAEAFSVAERLRSAVAEESFFPLTSGPPQSITISAGISAYRPPESIESFLERADRAMYQSKRTGRNRVTLLDHDL